MATDPLSEEPSPGSRYAQRMARSGIMWVLNRRLNPSAVRGMSSAECADAFTGFRINITVTPRASTLLRAPERPEGPKEEEHAFR